MDGTPAAGAGSLGGVEPLCRNVTSMTMSNPWPEIPKFSLRGSDVDACYTDDVLPNGTTSPTPP